MYTNSLRELVLFVLLIHGGYCEDVRCLLVLRSDQFNSSCRDMNVDTIRPCMVRTTEDMQALEAKKVGDMLDYVGFYHC
jgi:hypothetical protein